MSKSHSNILQILLHFILLGQRKIMNPLFKTCDMCPTTQFASSSERKINQLYIKMDLEGIWSSNNESDKIYRDVLFNVV